MNAEQPVFADRVRWPAIGLLLTGALGIVSLLGSLAWSFLAPAEMTQQQMREMPEFMRFLFSPAWLVGSSLVDLAVCAIVILGGVQMLRLKSYGLAVASSVLAMIPCFACCCVGLPAGIWALVVLFKPEVKQAFR